MNAHFLLLAGTLVYLTACASSHQEPAFARSAAVDSALQPFPQPEPWMEVCAMSLGEPYTNHVLADGTRVRTATITLRNSTRREVTLRFDAVDLRDTDRIVALDRVQLGEDVVRRTLEVKYISPPTGEELKGQTILSIKDAEGVPSSSAVPFAVRSCSPADSEELASMVCGCRTSARVMFEGESHVLPCGLGCWSLNGMGTDFVAECCTISPLMSGAGPVDLSLVGDLPVEAWPSPVVALLVRAELAPQK